MADERGREVERKISRGEIGLADAQKGLLYGTRTQNGDLFIKAAVAGAKTLPLGEQRRLLREVAQVVAEATQESRQASPQDYVSTKAFEIHGPEVGQVTPQEFISLLYDCVEDALCGKVHGAMSVSQTNRNSYGSAYQARTTDKKTILAAIESAFGEFDGSFTIACGSPIRVYALHKAPSPEELIRRKKTREVARLAEKRAKQEAALEELRSKEQAMREELAKVALRQKRIEKNLKDVNEQ